jgi:ketosteroid isomerase-like protein
MAQHGNSASWVLDRLGAALNEHDLEALVALFAPDYQSEQPLHPDRGFSGAEQVRRNWSGMFGSYPDFKAEQVRAAIQDDTVWTEWDWSGTHTDGSSLRARGVTIIGVRDGQIAWARLYMEPVQEEGSGNDESRAQ